MGGGGDGPVRIVRTGSRRSLALPGACAPTQPATPAAPAAFATPTESQSILPMSTPVAGSTVKGPVNELVLHFSRPARLGETVVTGPQDRMP